MAEFAYTIQVKGAGDVWLYLAPTGDGKSYILKESMVGCALWVDYVTAYLAATELCLKDDYRIRKHNVKGVARRHVSEDQFRMEEKILNACKHDGQEEKKE